MTKNSNIWAYGGHFNSNHHINSSQTLLNIILCSTLGSYFIFYIWVTLKRLCLCLPGLFPIAHCSPSMEMKCHSLCKQIKFCRLYNLALLLIHYACSFCCLDCLIVDTFEFQLFCDFACNYFICFFFLFLFFFLFWD